MFATGSLTTVIALFLIGSVGVSLGLIGLIVRGSRRGQSSAGRSDAKWLVVFAFGLLVASLGIFQSDHLVCEAPPQDVLDAKMPAYRLVKPSFSYPTTDQGRGVPVEVVQNFTPVSVEREEKYLAARKLANLITPTGQEDQNSNCHGWTFAAGKCWIMDEAVEMILQDNGYQPVQFPRPGDLAVYRDGAVSHTGIVRKADATTQRILIESKWTILGCFLHAPEQTPFAGMCSYYHTSRRDGHVLHGILENAAM